MFQCSERHGRLKKLGKKNVPLTADTENAKFTAHVDTWQNLQDKEETDKANSTIVLKLT